MSKIVRMNSTVFWRYLTNFWTLVFFGCIVIDFIYDNYLDERGIILTIAAIYGAVLAIYSTEKEFKRWSDSHTTVHPGEVYIILWTILVFSIIIIDTIADKSYHIPPEVSSAYILVVGILAITKESKRLYIDKNFDKSGDGDGGRSSGCEGADKSFSESGDENGADKNGNK